MQEKLHKLMLAMIAYNSGDAKRIQHFIKVHALAKLIGEEEKLDAKTLYILEAATAKRNTAPVPANNRKLKARLKRKSCCKALALVLTLRSAYAG